MLVVALARMMFVTRNIDR
ncbi:hypothetical protein ACLK17_27315 [Escherichia coli]